MEHNPTLQSLRDPRIPKHCTSKLRPLLLGEALMEMGKLSRQDIELVLSMQSISLLRFGEQANKLGLVTESDIEKALVSRNVNSYQDNSATEISSSLLTVVHPQHPFVESLRTLRSQLLLKLLRTRTCDGAVSIVSPQSGDGRSMLAANLAVLFSQAGMTCLIVDCNLRSPVQHLLLNVPNRLGLSAVLSGQADQSEIVPVPAVSGLFILPAGSPSANPQDLLSSSMFEKVVRNLSRRFDVVILDTPPSSRCADALIVAQASRAAVLVARRHKTSVAQLSALYTDLTSCGTAIGGVVLNEY